MNGLERTLRAAGRSSVSARAATAASTLAARAAREGLLDVAYTEIDSPYGRWLLARTPRGLVRLAFAGEDFEGVLGSLAARVSPRVLEAPGQLDDIRREIDEYLEGRRARFDVPLDWSLSTGFALRVRQACAEIPFGSVLTYGQIAALAGNPRAFRAAGNALATNPVPIVVPCHRVVRSGGDLGNYGGGAPMKHALLELEGALPERPGG